MSGYVESYIHRRVARAYQVLLERSPEVAATQALSFPIVPKVIMESHAFTPMKRLLARKLRELFSGERGREMSTILGCTQATFVVAQTENRAGQTQYGIGALGPYRLFHRRNLPFVQNKKSAPVLITFEEICFRAEDPKDVYETVYLILNTVTTNILGDEGGIFR